MTELLVGTDDGLHAPEGGRDPELRGRQVSALAADGPELWALLDRSVLARRDHGAWAEVAAVPEGDAGCVARTSAGLLVGGSEAGLFRLADAGLERVASFDEVEGREEWYTPWGGPPAVRSLSHDGTSSYVNVHVGGIPRSDDGGRSWSPTIDVDDDVHEVLTLTERPGTVLAATARGLATSEDRGKSWRYETRGLEATYCRAVAVSGETILLTASEGPRGGNAGVYRASLRESGPLERCLEGIPGPFERNIDTHCLVGSEELCAFGSQDGDVYASRDRGGSWELLAGGLPPIRCLALG